MSRQIENYGRPKKMHQIVSETKENQTADVQNAEKKPIKLHNEWWEFKKHWTISEEYLG